MCTDVGFYPNITLDPSENPLEFYSTPPRDGVLLLSRVSKEHQPIIAESLKQNASIVSPDDETRFVDAFVIGKADVDAPELAFVLEQLRARAAAAAIA